MARVAQQVRQLYEMCAVALVSGRANLDGASEVGPPNWPTSTRRPSASTTVSGSWCRSGPTAAPVAIPCATSRVWRTRSSSARTRASIWPASPASSTLRRRIASCAGRWPGCANPPAPACSPRTRTAASWKSNAAAVPVGGVGRFTSTPGRCPRVANGMTTVGRTTAAGPRPWSSGAWRKRWWNAGKPRTRREWDLPSNMRLVADRQPIAYCVCNAMFLGAMVPPALRRIVPDLW